MTYEPKQPYQLVLPKPTSAGRPLPPLPPKQRKVEGLVRSVLGMGSSTRNRNRGDPEATALREEPHRRRPSELLARMASNREPLIPPQLADSLDPLSSSASAARPPLPDLKSDAMSRDGVGADAGAPSLASSESAEGGGGRAGAVSEGGGAAVEKEEGGRGGAVPAEVDGGGGASRDSRGRGGVFAEVRNSCARRTILKNDDREESFKVDTGCFLPPLLCCSGCSGSFFVSCEVNCGPKECAGSQHMLCIDRYTAGVLLLTPAAAVVAP